MAFKSKKKFEYKARSEDEVRARATSGGNREGFLEEGVRTFSAKAGSHTVRILPPTWEDAKHYGLDLFAHYNIGPDGGAYLCLAKMKNDDCAICNERARAIKEEDEDLENALKPRQRVACWVIDRDNEREGPLLWMMPWTLDREIVQQSIDKKTGVVYALDSPGKPWSNEEGYDVSFERQGEGMTTKYVGVQLDRRSSPLSDDEENAEEWLKYVADHPIDDQLVFQDSDYLEKLVGDGLSAPKSSRDKMAKDSKRKGKDKDDDDDGKDDKPKRGAKPDRTSKKKKDEIDTEDLDWAAVHEMDEDELKALAEQEEIDIDDAGDEEEAADIICEALEIEEPKKPARGKKKDDDDDEGKDEKPTMKSRLAKLKGKAR